MGPMPLPDLVSPGLGAPAARGHSGAEVGVSEDGMGPMPLPDLVSPGLGAPAARGHCRAEVSVSEDGMAHAAPGFGGKI